MTTATDKAAADKVAADRVAADKAASDKLAAEKAMPKTANEVLAKVDDDHDWTAQPEDLTTTGGIQKAVKRNRDAIAALANFIDGKK